MSGDVRGEGKIRRGALERLARFLGGMRPRREMQAYCLLLHAGDGGMSNAELRRAMEAPTSATRMLLRSLVADGLVEKVRGEVPRYRLTVRGAREIFVMLHPLGVEILRNYEKGE